MRRALVRVAASLALAWVALCTLLFFAQRSLIYFPRERALPAGQSELRLANEAGELVVTTRELDGPRALLYFGGNAEDVSRGLGRLAAAFPEHALFLTHYRGYGGSDGRPSEAALAADALLLFDHVRERHAEVTVVGRSLGSGVAVRLAAERPVARLVLVTPFDSLVAVAAGHYPFVPVRWLLRDRFDAAARAGDVTAPVLILAADRDGVVPRARAEALFAAFRPGQARIEVLAGTDHDSVSGHPRYTTLLAGR